MVLVVEDNASMRALIRSLAEAASLVVEECQDGETALALYARVHPDLVLMDIRLGGMDGITTTRAIRQADPDARVVIVTEMDDAHHRRAAQEAGALAYVLKQNLLDLTSLLSAQGAG